MRDQTSNAALFDLAADIERLQARFYTALARMFSHVPEVSTFWAGMEKDENRHITVLTNLQASAPPGRLLTAAEPGVIDKAKQILATPVEARLLPLQTLDDAYDLAHELENSELNVVFEFVVREFSAGEEARRFALLAIERHLRKLSDFRVRQGSRAERRAIRARPLAAPPHDRSPGRR